MKNSQIIKTSIMALSLLSGSAIAATQGSLGVTSTGSLDITVDISSLVQVSNLTDLDLGTFSGGSTDLSGTDGFCVYRNGSGNFDIKMTGDGSANAFTLTDSGTNTVAYTVSFSNNGGAPQAVVTDTLLAGQGNANTTDTTCGGADNMSLTVTVAASDLAALPAGTYGGTLTMVVSPE